MSRFMSGVSFASGVFALDVSTYGLKLAGLWLLLFLLRCDWAKSGDIFIAILYACLSVALDCFLCVYKERWYRSNADTISHVSTIYL
ncbi:MAG: hypothetical protein K2G47_02260 [Muribaculum sp.]|nr:hypothetical protein [Muribaculum sp.]